jgi:hypothetical protein
MFPSSGEKLYLCDKWYLHSVWMTDWYTVWNETRLTETNCRIDTVLSPDYEQIIARNIYRKEINIIKKMCTNFALFTRPKYLSGHRPEFQD